MKTNVVLSFVYGLVLLAGVSSQSALARHCSHGFCEGDRVYDRHGMGEGFIDELTNRSVGLFVVNFYESGREGRLAEEISHSSNVVYGQSSRNCIRDLCVGDRVDDRQSPYNGEIVSVTKTGRFRVDLEGMVHLRRYEHLREIRW